MLITPAARLCAASTPSPRPSRVGGLSSMRTGQAVSPVGVSVRQRPGLRGTCQHLKRGHPVGPNAQWSAASRLPAKYSARAKCQSQAKFCGSNGLSRRPCSYGPMASTALRAFIRSTPNAKWPRAKLGLRAIAVFRSAIRAFHRASKHAGDCQGIMRVGVSLVELNGFSALPRSPLADRPRDRRSNQRQGAIQWRGQAKDVLPAASGRA